MRRAAAAIMGLVRMRSGFFQDGHQVGLRHHEFRHVPGVWPPFCGACTLAFLTNNSTHQSQWSGDLQYLVQVVLRKMQSTGLPPHSPLSLSLSCFVLLSLAYLSLLIYSPFSLWAPPSWQQDLHCTTNLNPPSLLLPVIPLPCVRHPRS